MTEQNTPDHTDDLPPQIAGEGGYDADFELNDPLGEKVSPTQARLIYRMTISNMIMRVLRFLLPHEATALAPQATEKLLEDGIIDRVVLGEGNTYVLIYERLVALGVIEDQKLGVEAMAYLNNNDPLQVRIDPSLAEDEMRANHSLGVVITAATFTADALLFNFDEDSFLVHASLVARVRKGGHALHRAVNFQYIYKCSDVGVLRNDPEEFKRVRSDALGVSQSAALEFLRDNPRVYFGAFGSASDEVVTLIDVDVFRATDHQNHIFI